ncbi:MAG: nicotinate phosphoribosyltransferase, partial [Anaerolineae bacterium]|nr:nicotinate phosphoribosyltransferase [Anaerolineae bacterium]
DRLIRRLTYGVGTRLITSHGHSALDGVYKLVAVRNRAGWEPAIKISETPDKTLNPGEKRVWRIYDRRGKATADLLCLAHEEPRSAARLLLHHPSDPEKWRVLTQDEISGIEPLLVDILVDGKLVYELPSLEDIRALRRADVERLDAGVKRLVNPHIYHVSLSEGLWNLKQELIHAARQKARAGQRSSPAL